MSQLSALQRKAGAGKPTGEAGGPSLARAARLALVRASDEVLETPVMIRTIDDARLGLADLIETVPELALFGRLTGPGGRVGLAVLDAQAVGAAVQALTTGRVSGRAGPERRPTRTDAVICGEWIDAILTQLDDELAEFPDRPAQIGFRFDSQLAERRQLSTGLEELPYRLLTLGVELGGQGRTGQLWLVFPDAPGRREPAGAAGDWSAKMEHAVMPAPVQLEARLWTLRLPIEAVTQLSAGDCLPVPRSATDEVQIRDGAGRILAHGRLGQSLGQRAVRLADLEGAGVHAAQVPSTSSAPSLAAPSPEIAPAPATDSLGDLPAPDDLPALDDLPPIGDLPPLGDLPEMGDLPPLDDLPDLGDLPSLDDLAKLS